MKDYKLKLTRIAVGLVALTVSISAYGQDQQKHLLLPGPNGVLVTTAKLFDIRHENNNWYFPAANQKIEIYKAGSKGKRFEKVATVSFPASADEMEKRLGESETAALFNQLKVSDMKSAYKIINQYGADTLGLLMLSQKFRKAFGMVYTDITWKPGQKVTYRFDRRTPSGTEKNIYSETLDGSLPQYTTKFKLLKYNTFDSSASAKWHAKIPTATNLPIYAQVYSLANPEEGFVQMGRTYIARISDDSATVYYSQENITNNRLAWYIRPLDLAGNLGLPSDTMYALAINKNQIEPIKNLTVTDTTGGLLLQWNPLPAEAIYGAIQILKSRQLGRDYVVLDTLASTQTAYLDEQIVPGSAYFYKVRPLLFNLPGTEPLTFTEASGFKSINDSIPPAAPQGLQAVIGKNGIELSWFPNNELNLFAYYVLRGTTLRTLEIVSGPVRNNKYVDSLFDKHYSGQYLYALQVLNLGQVMSDTSSVAAVQIRQPVVLLSPGGMQAHRTSEGLSLNWENTRKQDNSIVGYMLYRRETGNKYYKTINTEIIQLPSFNDSSALKRTSYDYAVSSIDAWGNQSILSPYQTVLPDNSEFLSPPDNVTLRNLTAGIEISWPKPYDTGKRKYVIYRSTLDGNVFKKLATVSPMTPYLDQTTNKNTLYKYAISIEVGNTEGDKSKTYMIRR